MMAKIVVALGGNALGKSPQEQLELVKNTAKSLVGLITKGHEIVISHVMDHRLEALIWDLTMLQNITKVRHFHLLNVAQ